jgi:hypothetical protein
VIGTAIYMSPEVMRGTDDDNDSVGGGRNAGYGRSTVRMLCSKVYIS